MTIEDIQHDKKQNKVTILLVDENLSPALTLHLDVCEVWEILEFCRNHLSLAAQKKA